MEYDKAIEIDPTDMTYLTNRYVLKTATGSAADQSCHRVIGIYALCCSSAAVILEQGDLEGCLEECKKAIEVGRKNYADYPLIAKAYARMGNACFKHKKVRVPRTLWKYLWRSMLIY